MTRRAKLWVAGGTVVLLVLLAAPVVVVAVALVGAASSASQAACPAPAPAKVLTSAPQLVASQLRIAGVIIATAVRYRTGAQGAVIGLAAALDESNLANLDHGDRDSLGVFQQRPSAGWGTPAQIMNVQYAANAFYDGAHVTPGHDRGLLQVVGWQQMTPGRAAQAVQRSAFPDPYDRFVPLAAQLVAGARVAGTVTVDNCQQDATVVLPGGVRLPDRVVAAIEAAPPAAQQAAAFALRQVGKPYQWGATGPDRFDCSGLTQAAWAAAGVSIPRTSQAQFSGLPAVHGQPQTGDLVFTEGNPPGHVMLALGGGWQIQAPHTGAVVFVGPLPTVVTGVARVSP